MNTALPRPLPPDLPIAMPTLRRIASHAALLPAALALMGAPAGAADRTLDQVKAAKPTRDYDPLYNTPGAFVTGDAFVEAVYRSLKK